MTDAAKRLLEEMLQLDADDREILIVELMHSLELSPEEQVAHDRARADEIDRRIADAVAHPEDSVDAFEFLEQLRGDENDGARAQEINRRIAHARTHPEEERDSYDVLDELKGELA